MSDAPGVVHITLQVNDPVLWQALRDVAASVRPAAAQALDVTDLRREIRELREMISCIGWNIEAARDRAALPAPASAADAADEDARDGSAAAPGQAQAADVAVVPASPAAPVVAGRWRTPERRQILERDWPAGRLVDEIRVKMEALGGAPTKGIATWANELRLQRPDRAALPAPASAADAADEDARDGSAAAPGQAQAADVAVVPASPAAPVVAGRWRTPERRQILERDWPAGRFVDEIRVKMEALGGAPTKGIATWANELRLQRPPGFMGKVGRRHRDAVASGDAGSASVLRSTARPAVIISGSGARIVRPPPAGGASAVPPALVTRDGHFSTATAQLRADVAASVVVAISLTEAALWGSRNGVTIGKGDRAADIIARVNDRRRHFGLPPFRLVKAQSPLDPLPDPHVGANYKGAA